MADQICKECNDTIIDREFLICSDCDEYYHLKCTNISPKLYYLKSPIKRRRFQCKSCVKKLQDNDCVLNQSSPLTESLETATRNVTTRKKIITNKVASNSFGSLSVDENFEYSSLTSTPTHVDIGGSNLTDKNTKDCISKLNEKLCELQRKLDNADKEIEDLISENYILKKEIAEFKSKPERCVCILSSKIKNVSNTNRSQSINEVESNLFNSAENKETPNNIESKNHNSTINQKEQHKNCKPINYRSNIERISNSLFMNPTTPDI
ncbi:unnamed protein product [Parnassius apollo]|uniref:(apollo) hypothetical protein n=1 Tax=Parnassius apollo TaxID=110799 RepID=A0A8S3WM19_PARAO|nr:unnamed protein product [Parnassius apollo]